MQEPVYIKIHNQLKKDIENKKYAVGARIPAERKLALEFNVSRMTLRQAIKTLEDEGILERRLGSGTYVASQKVKKDDGHNVIHRYYQIESSDGFYSVDFLSCHSTIID